MQPHSSSAPRILLRPHLKWWTVSHDNPPLSFRLRKPCSSSLRRKSAKKLPLLYSEAFPRENVNVFFRITKQHLQNHPVLNVTLPDVSTRFSDFRNACLPGLGPRIDHLNGNRRRLPPYTQRSLKRKV